MSAQALVALVAALPPAERQRLLNALTAGNADADDADDADDAGNTAATEEVNREGTN